MGTGIKQQRGMIRAQQVISEVGGDVSLIPDPEADQDAYGSVKDVHGTPINLKAHPIVYGPTLKQLEDAGIRAVSTAVVWFSTLDLEKLGLVDSEGRFLVNPNWGRAQINSVEYKITEASKPPRYEISGKNMYRTLGLIKN